MRGLRAATAAIGAKPHASLRWNVPDASAAHAALLDDPG